MVLHTRSREHTRRMEYEKCPYIGVLCCGLIFMYSLMSFKPTQIYRVRAIDNPTLNFLLS